MLTRWGLRSSLFSCVFPHFICFRDNEVPEITDSTGPLPETRALVYNALTIRLQEKTTACQKGWVPAVHRRLHTRLGSQLWCLQELLIYLKAKKDVLSVSVDTEENLHLYLQDVTLCQLKSAGSDVDAFACLDLNAVHTFMAVAIVHWIVWRQKNSLIFGNCWATLRCKDAKQTQAKTINIINYTSSKHL